jgi:aminopeptidase
MADARIEKLADVLVDYSIDVQPGMQVAISGEPISAPLIRALYRRVLRRRAHPVVRVRLSEEEAIFYRVAQDEQLDFISPLQRLVTETFDATIGIWSETNTRRLTCVPPERQARRERATRALSDIFFRRSADHSLRWVGTLYPTEAHAQDADMSLEDYEDFVYGAGLLDDPDPVARWREVDAAHARLIAWLKDKQRVHVRGPNIDLRLSIAGRVFDNGNGRANFPDGEIWTGPVEDSVEGWVKFTYPAIENGREVEGVELVFEQGRVVKASARKNEDFLLHMLDVDEGARRLGEFAIGTNRGIQRFTRNTLFDEKIGGTIHMALGASYKETGGLNESAIHWDIVCDMRPDGEIWVDDVLFYKAGEFLI